MDTRLLKRAKHTFWWFRCIGRDGYGDKEFDEPVEIKCYRHGKVSKVVNLAGEEVVTSLQLICDGILQLGEDDEVAFPTLEDRHRVVSVSHFDGLRDNTGTTVVYL